MSADTKWLSLAAQGSDDCLPWLEHCHAECCRAFRFRLNPTSWVDRQDDEVHVHVRMTPDLRRYYELHGARVEGDVVVFPESRCESTDDGMHVSMTCTALREDCLCSLHPDRKPDACSGLKLDTAHERGYWLPSTCQYTYKLRLLDGEDPGPR